MLTDSEFNTILMALKSEEHFLYAVENHGMDTSAQRSAVLSTKAKFQSLKEQMTAKPEEKAEGPKLVD